MVGKLIKHEFRATARIMLLIYAAVAAAAVLANISIRLLDVTDSSILQALFVLIIITFTVGVVAAVVITAVVMVGRFYGSLLRSQGYLMHTLPVTVHGHIWSKLIVSCVWFAGTFLLVWLVTLATVLIQSGTDLGAMLSELPSLGELFAALREHGVSLGGLALLAGEIFCLVIVGCLMLCLHFYAAMSLGHMFSRKQILLTIAFYIGIDFVFNIAETTAFVISSQDPSLIRAVVEAETFAQALAAMQGIAGIVLLVELAGTALLYLATCLPLKKRLNLA